MARDEHGHPVFAPDGPGDYPDARTWHRTRCFYAGLWDEGRIERAWQEEQARRA